MHDRALCMGLMTAAFAASSCVIVHHRKSSSGAVEKDNQGGSWQLNLCQPSQVLFLSALPITGMMVL